MSPKRSPLTPNFSLDELIPKGWDGSVPAEVLGNLIALCETVLEPARAYLGRSIHPDDGWRPAAHNAAVGGVKESDHLVGAAADVWASGTDEESWQDATVRLFHWMRVHLKGRYGQLILEDRREHEKRDNALVIHVSIPTKKHPGHDDASAVLVSRQKGHYQAFEEPRA